MPTFINTKTTLGEDGALDALVAHELTEFNDDTITAIGQNAFQYQDTLESIYLPKVQSIAQNAFLNCSALKNLYIGTDRSAVSTLSSTNALSGTGRGLIRVPDDLVTNYRSATNWSTYAGRIYGINDSTAPQWDETEITDDWATIASYVNAGTAASRYSIGQYKEIDLGTEGVIRMQIVDKNVRELANSTDTAQLEWVAMEALKTTHRMNPALDSNTEGTGTIGGYDKSEMKTYLDTDIWALVPSEVQGIIKETKIVTRIYNTSGSAVQNEVTTAKLRIPSYREMVGDTNRESQGPSYGFAFPGGNERVRKTAGTTSAVIWWLRSANNTNSFHYVYSNGNYNFNSAQIALSVVLGFST